MPDPGNLEEVKFILAQRLRGVSHGLTVWLEGRNGLVEESCSLHGNLEAETKLRNQGHK